MMKVEIKFELDNIDDVLTVLAALDGKKVKSEEKKPFLREPLPKPDTPVKHSMHVASYRYKGYAIEVGQIWQACAKEEVGRKIRIKSLDIVNRKVWPETISKTKSVSRANGHSISFDWLIAHFELVK